MTMLRSYAFAAFLAVSLAIMGVILLPATLFGKDAARRFSKIWARTGLTAARIIAGVSYRIEGTENIPKGGALVAANHQSMWETLALYALLPRPVIIFKKELLRIPIYGWWVSAAGNVAVDRKGGAKALRQMQAAARAAIADGDQVIVFPEGTRVGVGDIAAFQPGVAGIYKTAEAPCVPAAHDSGRFWRLGVDIVPGEITLRFLPAITPGLDRKTFLHRLKTAIEAARPDLVNSKSQPLETAHG